MDNTEKAYSPGAKYIGAKLNFVDVPNPALGVAGTLTSPGFLTTKDPCITSPAEGMPLTTLRNSTETGNSESFVAKYNSRDVIANPCGYLEASTKNVCVIGLNAEDASCVPLVPAGGITELPVPEDNVSSNLVLVV